MWTVKVSPSMTRRSQRETHPHPCAPEHSHPTWKVWGNVSLLPQESPSPGRTARLWTTLTGSRGPCSLGRGARSPWGVPSWRDRKGSGILSTANPPTVGSSARRKRVSIRAAVERATDLCWRGDGRPPSFLPWGADLQLCLPFLQTSDRLHVCVPQGPRGRQRCWWSSSWRSSPSSSPLAL